MTYLDFELEISEGAGREYPVAVLHSPAGEARETMRFPFDTLALENRLKDLQIALLRSGGKTRKMPLPEEQAVQDFGRALFDALFIGEVRTRYDLSRREATQKDLGLRLKLRIQSPSLAALPWEFLYDSRQAEYVCLSRNTPIVRYLELPQPIQPLTVAPPLRILGMAVSPNDPRLGKLDVEREKQRVENATKYLRARGVLELTWLPGQTWRDLHTAMRAGPWHIFHFIGHGGFDQHRDEGLIYLANNRGESEHLPATSLARLLADHRSLRLVLLNACEGARGSDSGLFSSTATILVRRGLPAVLAMQYEITDHAAIEFSRNFYEVLAEGAAVDTAVVEARKAVSFAVTNTIEWGTPVLYMRAPNGQLFNFVQRQAPLPPPPIDFAEQRRSEIAKLQHEAEEAVAREDWRAASEKYQRILELQSNHAAALAGLKHVQQEQQLTVLYTEAKQHIAAKRWSQAIATLEKARSLSTNYKDVVQLLDASKKALEEETARTEVEARRIELENAQREAEQAIAHDELSVALQAYQRMLKIEPNHSIARAGMERLKKELDLKALYFEAKSHEAGKRWSAALTNLQKVRVLAPNYKDAAQLIASIERKLAEENQREKVAGLLREAEAATAREDWPAAIQAIQELLALDPTHAEAKSILRSAQQEQELARLYEEGKAHLTAKRWQLAIESFRRVQELRGRNEDVKALLASAEREWRKERETQKPQAPLPAPRTTKSSSRVWLVPGLLLTVAVLTWLIMQYGDWGQTDKQATPARPSMSRTDSLYITYVAEGDSLFQRNDFASAKRKYQQALAQKPGDAAVTAKLNACEQKLNEAGRDKLYAQYRNEGDALYKQKKYAEARNKFEDALQQKPNDGYATARKQACEERLGEQQTSFENYKAAGDRLFNQGEYLGAKDQYEKAFSFRENDSYLANQIKECDRLLTLTIERAMKNIPAGMVLIPGGTFTMGSNNGDGDEKPPHQVSVEAFYMDKYEVTVGQYQKFLAATPSQQQPTNWNEQLQNPNRPVVYVSWNEAVAYCNWLGQQRGKHVRLPTEAEWEYAARGGLSGKKYPWGDEISQSQANYNNPWSAEWSKGPSKYLREVGSYSANNYGLFDMAGNVWEWCSSLYKPYPYSRSDGREGLSASGSRVLRGGSWYLNPNLLRCADRVNDVPTGRSSSFGFRCSQGVR